MLWQLAQQSREADHARETADAFVSLMTVLMGLPAIRPYWCHRPGLSTFSGKRDSPLLIVCFWYNQQGKQNYACKYGHAPHLVV